MTMPDHTLDEFPWSAHVKALRYWFLAFMLLWVFGVAWAIGSDFKQLWLLFVSIVPYIGSIVYAYKVQDDLNRTGVYKAGAWQVIAGAFLLNPLLFGFLIPTSVLLKAGSVGRKIRAGKMNPPAVRPADNPVVARYAPAVGAPISPTDDLETGVRIATARSNLVLFLMAGMIALTLFGILASLSQLHVIQQIAAGLKPAAGAAEAADTRKQFVVTVDLLGYFATAIAWFFWQHRAYANLRLIGSRETEYTPGWSVGWWFVPIANLFRPYSIMAELWRRSASHNEPGQSSDASGSSLIGGWWLCYVAATLLSRLANSYFSSAAVASDYVSAMYVSIASDVLLLVAAVLALRMIRGIARLQAGFTVTSATLA